MFSRRLTLVINKLSKPTYLQKCTSCRPHLTSNMAPTRVPARSMSLNIERHISGRENKFKREDGIPQDWEMIYRGPLTNYVYALHSISVASIIGFLGTAAVFIPSSGSNELLTIDTFSSAFAQFSSLEMTCFLGGLISMNIMSLMVIQEYVCRVYQKDEDYKMVQMGLLPWMKRVVDLKAGDLNEYEGLASIPWKDHRFKAKDKVVILFENYFKSPAHLLSMFKKGDEES